MRRTEEDRRNRQAGHRRGSKSREISQNMRGKSRSEQPGRGEPLEERRPVSPLTRGLRRFLVRLFLVFMVFCAGVSVGWYRWGRKGSAVQLSQVKAPAWVKQDLIRTNIYSRPGSTLRQVNDIVIHYVANPGSTAEQNRNYFNRLADQTGSDTTSVSAHFIVGLEGEIIQCIPMDEIAYASNSRNGDTISIECCHPDETGKFNDRTYASLVKLTAWLCDEAGISRKNVIRHYDVTGKSCPKYFVDHEDAWKQFKRDVKAYKE